VDDLVNYITFDADANAQFRVRYMIDHRRAQPVAPTHGGGGEK
jgi:hypothetical protein